MAHHSYRFTKARVDEILKHLPSSEDRAILDAYIEDRVVEARQKRPFATFAALLPVGLGVAVGLILGIPHLPEAPCSECEECEECPPPVECPPPPTPEWRSLQNHPLKYTRGEHQRCYWPEGEDVVLCITEDQPPTTVPEPLE